MEKPRKMMKFMGLIIFLFVLTACGKNGRSNPDASLENFFSSVEDMNFEESYEFMDDELGSQFRAKMGGNLEDDLPEELKNIKSYQNYQSEIAKLYKKMDYDIIDRIDHEVISSGADDQKFMREYVIQVTVPNIDNITADAAMSSIDSLFGAFFTGEIDPESYDEIYTELVENLKNEEIEEEIVEGIIYIDSYEADHDPNEKIWLISHMDENIFNILTPAW